MCIDVYIYVYLFQPKFHFEWNQSGDLGIAWVEWLRACVHKVRRGRGLYGAPLAADLINEYIYMYLLYIYIYI